MPSAARKTTTCSGYLRQVNIPLVAKETDQKAMRNTMKRQEIDRGVLQMALVGFEAKRAEIDAAIDAMR